MKDPIYCTGYVKSADDIVDTLITIRRGLTGRPRTMDAPNGLEALNMPSKPSAIEPLAHGFTYDKTVQTDDGSALDVMNSSQTIFRNRRPHLASPVKAATEVDDFAVKMATAVLGAGNRFEIIPCIGTVATWRRLEDTAARPISPEQLGWKDMIVDRPAFWSSYFRAWVVDSKGHP
ncbi:hypothetical protein M422DRAFT_274087 [Sphaerobolus stellatus SS14]|uniref:Uncharacterized protein n=1 Tax=Sphaerobolus stellatus (strain SS14) TaxID=990650 RepID=A0A0C9UI03_SPHS4|nr:hypothetical protein M422DRAFT_274087 [Sphaerobolus stellatus SS14]